MTPTDQNPMGGNPTDLLTEAGMMATAGKKIIIYVEGDSDRRLYRSLFTSAVDVIPADNFANVEELVRKYDDSDDKTVLPLVLGIVDRDYRVAAKEVAVNVNLICTELRDIECEMVQSDAFEHLVDEYASEKLFKTWADVHAFRSCLVASTAVIGKVRFYNHISKSGIDFKKLNCEKVLDLKKHAIDGEGLISHLRGAQRKGQAFPKTYSDVEKKISRKEYDKHVCNPMRMARGHDIFEILAIYFKKSYGRSAAIISAETLESGIRLAFNACMKSSPTIQKILNWFLTRNLQFALA